MQRKSPSGQLEGKVALVTGSSRGIGRAIALGLAREGALVAAHYFANANMATALVDEIRADGGDAFSLQADFRSIAGVTALFEQMDHELQNRFDSTAFDILVNNAAIAPRAVLQDTTEPMFDEIFEVNVKAPFFIAQAAESRMRRGGRVINLSSVVTRIGYPPEAAYALSKGAIDVLTLVLAKQFGERGITVNTLSPGVIDTDMNKELLANPEARSYVEGISVLQRVGKIDDVADIAVFLASDAGRWVTGQSVDASGGAFIS